MEREPEKQLQLPAIFSSSRGLTPTYGSSYGRIKGRESDGSLEPVRKSQRVHAHSRSMQEVASHTRSKGSHHTRNAQVFASRVNYKTHHKSSSSSHIVKAISLPALPPVPKTFDDFLTAANRAVARKRMQARWAPEAVETRYEATKTFYREKQQEVAMRHARNASKTHDASPWLKLNSRSLDLDEASPGGASDSTPSALISSKNSPCASPSAAVAQLPPIGVSDTSHPARRGAVLVQMNMPTLACMLSRPKVEERQISEESSPGGQSSVMPSRPGSPADKPEVTEEPLTSVKKQQDKFDRAWNEVYDPSGHDRDEAYYIFVIFDRMLYEGDNELHKDELPFMVDYFGYLLNDESSIERIAGGITQCTTLSFEEFLKFLHTYLVFEQETWDLTFAKYDADNSGNISHTELKAVLNDLGYTPMQNTLQEALQEVDSDQSGHIDFVEFKQLMSNWRAMEGLTKEEYSELKGLFNLFDSDSDGELSVPDQIRLKRYLGFTEENKDSRLNSRRQSLPIAWKRFLGEIHRCREQEVKKFRQLFDKQDTDKSGALDKNEILKVIADTGFEPLKKRLDECMAEVDEDGSGALNFEEFVQLMWLYRRTEGFTKEEQAELKAVFKKFDQDDSGEVSTLELGDLLRFEGYQPDFQQVQYLVDNFDVDGSGDIGLREFYKIMRSYREAEIKLYRKVFTKHDRDGSNSISSAEVAGVLKDLGKQVSLSIVQEAISSVDADNSGCLDWDEFVQLMEIYRKMEVREKRRRCGFTDQKVLEFQESFRGYDKDGSDDLDNLELMKLLGDLKMAPRTAFEQMHMISRLADCREQAEENTGKTTFWAFLRLLRTLEDDQDRGSLNVERKAAEEAGFTMDEVREFREIFNHWHTKLASLGENCGAASSGTALTTEGIARILRSLGVTLPAKSDYEALGVICASCDIDGNGSVDFPDFLRVMRQLLDTNFRNINEYIAGHAS